MKKLLFTTLFAFFSFVLLHAQQKEPISQEEAKDIVFQKVLNHKTEGINLFVSKKVVSANSHLKTIVGEELSPDYDSWFFFIDDMPMESWEHPCRYVFISTINGQLTITQKRMPPVLSTMKNIITHKVQRSDEPLVKIKPDNSLSRSMPHCTSIGNNYAVIINGGVDLYNNHERYWNHCSAVYQTLVNVYDVPKNNIYVLMSDGTDPAIDLHMINNTYQSSPLDLDGDGIGDIQYAATRSNVASVFNTLKNTLTSNDNLFVFTTDHGGRTSGLQTYLCLWNSEILYDYEFADYISQINANNINLCLVQCHSGGFIDNITNNNVVISTSCRYDESAWAMDDLRYSEYIYHWISAVAGVTPDGVIVNADTDNNEFVSMREAFLYAEAQDTQNEHPQYSSNPTDLGLNMIVTGSDMYISGPTIPCSLEMYTVENLPSGYTVDWTWTGIGLTVDSIPILVEPYYSANNYFKLQRSNQNYAKGVLTANIQQSGFTVATLSKTIDTGINFSGTWKQDSGTPSVLECNHVYTFTMGSTVTLTSNKFIGTTVSSTSIGIGPWSGVIHNDSTITFVTAPTFPINNQNNGIIKLGCYITITVKDNVTCETYKFIFEEENSLPPVPMLNVSSCGSEYTFFMNQQSVNDSVLPWQIEVVQYDTGKIVCSQNSDNGTTTINTSGWKAGIYVVAAVVGNQVVETKKIVVK